MNKRAAIEATKATALLMGALFFLINLLWLGAFLFAHHPGWGVFLLASGLAAGIWWIVYRDESR